MSIQITKISIIILAIATLYSCKSQPRKLPIYGNKKVKQKIVNAKKMIDTVYQTIPNFSFLNQDSVYITNQMFDGKVYIADFFFTSCPSICPIIHRNMLTIYNKFKESSQLLYLSHSIDFKYDVPHVLKDYSKKLGVTDSRWQFVNGKREEIYPLAEKSYLSAVELSPDAPGGYAHSGYLILVDKHGRVRGAYLGTDDLEVEQLIKDTELLLHEE